jgi:hypothetical protein
MTGMRQVRVRWTGRGLPSVGSVAAVAASLVIAACGQDPQAPDLNEYGIPVDPTNNMVMPVLFGLVVATGLLVVAAYVVWRLGREKDALPKPGREDAWWTCGGCGTLNTADRDACFSCHASRHADPAGTLRGGDPKTD